MTGVRPAFALLWASETAFDLGSALMTFALGVWIFQRTGSPQQFSGAILAAAVPTLVMTPVAGALADRFDRRWVIAVCDAASALLIAVLAVLLFAGRFALDQLYLFNAGSAVIAAIRIPAYRAAMGSIVPRDRLTQAGGLIGLTRSLLQVGAPLIAGVVMGAAGLTGVIAVQILLVVAGGLAAFRGLSRARHAIRGVHRARRSSVLGDVVASFRVALRYLARVPAMAGVAIYGAVQEALLVLAASMMIPLVLSSRGSDAVGVILSAGALGSLAGSALLVAVPLRRHLMRWMLVGNVCVSLFVLVVGFAGSTATWSVAAFGAYVGGTASGACASALLVRKTPVAIRGSVFALNAALNGVMMCAAMGVGGYLAEHVFEPALAIGGPWADTVGAWIGAGKGRGLGFMFIVCGALGGALSLLALVPGRFRNFDELTRDPADPADETTTVTTIEPRAEPPRPAPTQRPLRQRSGLTLPTNDAGHTQRHREHP
jgi:diaminobutyrate-2-oxoglutarate transaminase